MARQRQRFCIHGHDKEKTGVYWTDRITVAGNKTRERICAECHRIRDRKRYYERIQKKKEIRAIK